MKEFSLKVIMFKEKDVFIIHSPALDLSSCGDTKAEAEKNFAEAVELFFKEIKSMDTLDEVLLELGWQKKSAKKHTFIPPHLLNIKLPMPKGISV